MDATSFVGDDRREVVLRRLGVKVRFRRVRFRRVRFRRARQDQSQVSDTGRDQVQRAMFWQVKHAKRALKQQRSNSCPFSKWFEDGSNLGRSSCVAPTVDVNVETKSMQLSAMLDHGDRSTEMCERATNADQLAQMQRKVARYARKAGDRPFLARKGPLHQLLHLRTLLRTEPQLQPTVMQGRHEKVKLSANET